MKKKKFLYWTPRVLAIAFIVFISLFALDVFNEGYSFGNLLLALFMHLIPSLILLVITLVAWRREKIGGALFIILAIIFTFFFDTYESVVTFFLLSIPLFIIGILFFWQAIKK